MTFVFVLCGVFLAMVPLVKNSCFQTPLEPIPQPCTIRNLSVVSTSIPGNKIECGTLVNYNLLSTQPDIYFEEFNQRKYKSSEFILLAYDATFNQLLWALSHLKRGNQNIIYHTDEETSILKHQKSTVYEPGRGSYGKSAYQSVNKDPSKKYRVLIFEVFEIKPNISKTAVVTVNKKDVSSFNLYEWLSRQINSGIKLCGPVAATQIAVYTDSASNTEKDLQLHGFLPTIIKMNSKFKSSSNFRPLGSEFDLEEKLLDSKSQSFNSPALDSPKVLTSTEVGQLSSSSKAPGKKAEPTKELQPSSVQTNSSEQPKSSSNKQNLTMELKSSDSKKESSKSSQLTDTKNVSKLPTASGEPLKSSESSTDVKKPESSISNEETSKSSESFVNKTEPFRQPESSDNEKKDVKEPQLSVDKMEPSTESSVGEKKPPEQTESSNDKNVFSKATKLPYDKKERKPHESSSGKEQASHQPELPGDKKDVSIHSTDKEDESTKPGNKNQSNFGVDFQPNWVVIFFVVIISIFCSINLS